MGRLHGGRGNGPEIKIESRVETGREPVQAIEDILLDAVAFSAPLGAESDD